MGLYLDSGYINQKWIEDVADKNNISFIIEIGGRQVGKTYGTLQLMLQEGRRFVLMRRTQAECDFITNGINNPFTKYRGYDIEVGKDTKYTGAIYNTPTEGDNPQYIGAIMALSTVAKIRGFNGDMYTDLVFDEFIPENHVMKIKNEGDAFANAIVTISGNRELEGEKPLRVWLLANANTLDSAILRQLNLMEKVESMSRNGQEIAVLSERGIMVILPNSEMILSRRKKTALMRAIDTESDFAQMAMDNKFSYNDDSNLKKVNLREYRELFAVADRFSVYQHKNGFQMYVCKPMQSKTVYQDTEKDRVYCQRTYYNVRPLYYSNYISFSDMTTKINFTNYFALR